MDFSNKRCLIAFYSRVGQNYHNGQIVDLKHGNTAVVANLIQQGIGGDLFRIDTVKPYPQDYHQTTKLAQDELRSRARPQIVGKVADLGAYDLIFLGFPNWWGTAPMPVFSFLDGYDFSGKTIIPFCTHEGSGLGHSERDIAQSCPTAKVFGGIAIQGSSVGSASVKVSAWLKSL